MQIQSQARSDRFRRSIESDSDYAARADYQISGILPSADIADFELIFLDSLCQLDATDHYRCCAQRLASVLFEQWDDAILYRTLTRAKAASHT